MTWSVALAPALDLRGKEREESSRLEPRLWLQPLPHLCSLETVSPASLKDADEEWNPSTCWIHISRCPRHPRPAVCLSPISRCSIMQQDLAAPKCHLSRWVVPVSIWSDSHLWVPASFTDSALIIRIRKVTFSTRLFPVPRLVSCPSLLPLPPPLPALLEHLSKTSLLTKVSFSKLNEPG